MLLLHMTQIPRHFSEIVFLTSSVSREHHGSLKICGPVAPSPIRTGSIEQDWMRTKSSTLLKQQQAAHWQGDIDAAISTLEGTQRLSSAFRPHRTRSTI